MMRSQIIQLVTGLMMVAMFFAETAHAQSSHQGFVNIGNGRALYVDYVAPAPGKPLVVLLNGLTYKVSSWDRFVQSLQKLDTGLGILRYDMTGQGRTLLKYAPIMDAIALRDQVDELHLLLNSLKISQPVHLVSLSYGGAVAIPYATQHPSRVASVILMAPFVAPLTSIDNWIQLQIQQTRLTFPMNPASDDELYDYFLHVIVYSTYPAAEPVVLENPYKLEATYRLVQGSRKFLASDYVHALPAGKVHLMIARQDQYIENYVHDNFWNVLPKRARASKIVIDGSEHKIPEAIPDFSAEWVRRIIGKDPLLSGDRSYYGTVHDGKIVPL